MEEVKMIVISLLSSAITLLLKAFLDNKSEKRKNRMELQKQVFQRKTDAVENAMSWYQEAIDCFSTMQMACKGLKEDFNTFDYSLYILTAQKVKQLSEETAEKLNPLYLYYNVSRIEQQFDTTHSLYYIIYALKEISNLDQKARELSEKGFAPDSIEIKNVMNQGKVLFDGLYKALDVHIESMANIQKRLRLEYQSYSFEEEKKKTWWH